MFNSEYVHQHWGLFTPASVVITLKESIYFNTEFLTLWNLQCRDHRNCRSLIQYQGLGGGFSENYLPSNTTRNKDHETEKSKINDILGTIH